MSRTFSSSLRGGPQNCGLLLQAGLAAAAITSLTAAALTYRNHGSGRKISSKNLVIPPKLLASPYAQELQVAVELALEGACVSMLTIERIIGVCLVVKRCNCAKKGWMVFLFLPNINLTTKHLVIGAFVFAFARSAHKNHYIIIFPNTYHTLLKLAGRAMIGYLDAKGTEKEDHFDLNVQNKTNSADFCTKVDLENERLVSNGIRYHFPTHDIIGEEDVGTDDVPPLHATTPTWIIDPIDGTTNFSSGLSALTCVSIGLCCPTEMQRATGGNELRNRPVMGVVYAPGTNDLYLAVRGHGAYRNGVKIYQKKASACKTLQEAVVGCEFGYSRKKEEVDAMLDAVSKMMSTGCRAIRQLGSGVLDLCLVASGRLDLVYSGVVNEGWKPWDYAAALVICEEAGCVMETIEQERPDQDFDLYGKSVMAAVSRELVDETRLVLFFY